MKNKLVLDLLDGLPMVDPPDMDGDFNYAISANLLEAERVAPSIKKGIKPSEKYEEYEKKAKELMDKYAEKDALGDVITEQLTVGNRTLIRYNIPGLGDPESDYSKALDKLKEEYKKEIDAHEKKLEFLDKENKEFKPVMIAKSTIPNALSRAGMTLIMPLIEKKK